MTIDRRTFLGSLLPLLMARSGIASSQDAADTIAGDPAIGKGLLEIRKATGVPGLTSAIAKPGKPTRVAAVGVRKEGSPEVFGAEDLVHLGSDTKAMTATMIATLVEEEKLAWTSTLGEIFPSAEMNPAFKPVTLEQLLTHRSGLPANVDWWSLGSEKSTTEQRLALLDRVIRQAPKSTPGTTFLYSNVGYALAGLMAETVAKTSWEDLMRERLFKPLEMASAGFGPPGALGKIDQPWGHGEHKGKLTPSQEDNAPPLGPAGTCHCTMSDWAKFVNLHLLGAKGEKTPILKPETFHALQTPKEGEEYAKGWTVTKRPWAGGKVLTHSGSNTQWFCVAWLAVEKGFALLAATNLGGDTAQKATDQAVAGMIKLV